MNFASDNASGVAPSIMAALEAVNTGAVMPYGNDETTRRLEQRFAEIFETDLAVFPVATGTAANALGLAAVTPPYGAIYCHPEAHINCDECGAPEFFSGGAKLVGVRGAHGKIAAADLARMLDAAGIGVVHHVQPAAVCLSQATESGTVYGADETGAIAEVARSRGLRLHMDGARFANAVVHLGCTPAEATWKAGVDVLAFGATKNGAMGAEAVIFFDPGLAAGFGYRRKRAGHLFSKMRYVTAQLLAYLEEDLWLINARHANKQASRLARGLSALPGCTLIHPVDGNQVFARMPPHVLDALDSAGFLFYRWPDERSGVIRLVCSFQTTEEAVDAFIATAAKSCDITNKGR